MSTRCERDCFYFRMGCMNINEHSPRNSSVALDDGRLQPIGSDSIVFNQSSITSAIAALMLTLSVNAPSDLIVYISRCGFTY